METESVYQVGMDKSVLVKRENDELCVIVASMQKYIQFTPIESVLL